MRSRSTASKRQVRSLRKFLDVNYPFAIDRDEQKFSEHTEDLVSILTKPRSPLHHFFEKFRKLRSWSCFQVRKPTPVSPRTSLYSSRGLAAFANVIIVVIGLAMLFGPMWWLNFVQNNEKRLGIITGFTFAFTLVLVGSTIDQPFQVLAGTAAYAAVLMVFLQTTSSKS
jgi:hypothetical protein